METEIFLYYTKYYNEFLADFNLFSIIRLFLKMIRRKFDLARYFYVRSNETRDFPEFSKEELSVKMLVQERIKARKAESTEEKISFLICKSCSCSVGEKWGCPKRDSFLSSPICWKIMKMFYCPTVIVVLALVHSFVSLASWISNTVT